MKTLQYILRGVICVFYLGAVGGWLATLLLAHDRWDVVFATFFIFMGVSHWEKAKRDWFAVENLTKVP